MWVGMLWGLVVGVRGMELRKENAFLCGAWVGDDAGWRLGMTLSMGVGWGCEGIRSFTASLINFIKICSADECKKVTTNNKNIPFRQALGE